MKLDPGIHIVKHLVFFGKSGVTPDRRGACPAGGELRPPPPTRSSAPCSSAPSLLATGAGGATRDQLLVVLSRNNGPDAADSLHVLSEHVS
jgi:hypothetical protein